MPYNSDFSPPNSYDGFHFKDYTPSLMITSFENEKDYIFSKDGGLTFEQARILGLDLTDNLI